MEEAIEVPKIADYLIKTRKSKSDFTEFEKNLDHPPISQKQP
jgi:hypothetical protein